MATKPILFSGPMVRALLEGRKTQTRRVLKTQPHAGLRDSVFVASGVEDGHGREIKIPYYPGDVLWVRETWREDCPDDPTGAIYRADEEHRMPRGGKWKPGIYMFRWASRLTLEVTNVKVERLQDISKEDAIAEGAGLYVPGHGFITESELHADPGYSNFLSPRMGFEGVWTEINGSASWEANPWVVAISFTVHKCNVDQFQKIEEAA